LQKIDRQLKKLSKEYLMSIMGAINDREQLVIDEEERKEKQRKDDKREAAMMESRARKKKKGHKAEEEARELVQRREAARILPEREQFSQDMSTTDEVTAIAPAVATVCDELKALKLEKLLLLGSTPEDEELDKILEIKEGMEKLIRGSKKMRDAEARLAVLENSLFRSRSPSPRTRSWSPERKYEGLSPLSPLVMGTKPCTIRDR